MIILLEVEECGYIVLSAFEAYGLTLEDKVRHKESGGVVIHTLQHLLVAALDLLGTVLYSLLLNRLILCLLESYLKNLVDDP